MDLILNGGAVLTALWLLFNVTKNHNHKDSESNYRSNDPLPMQKPKRATAGDDAFDD